jgi:hypothetical protein
MTTIWGLRLSGYLAWRKHGAPEDPHYQAMRRHWGERFGLISLVTVFALQGVLMWIVSLPVGQIGTTPTSACSRSSGSRCGSSRARARSSRGHPAARDAAASRAAAHGRQHRDLRTVAHGCGVAGVGLVAVEPHARGREHVDEHRAVACARDVENLSDGAGLDGVAVGARGLAGRGEEQERDAGHGGRD